ncbi:ABC transporter ATP-binding protein [Salinisphaera sp. USBA-960]|uniref:ABC transporter ATP-binding protein n=1 Tax=Salinisphaera orenii TaxID=856731 RepID=UPI000DBE8324|nr:ABC transporter ATP-binding protein [Salifodinibacter halophilus]NNC27097.1 ABC transporter ATP-binding protein [Salifodinibacter halophilus]
MALLAVDSITCGYGDMEVLSDVSAVVEAGEIVSIIGPNGAGKSTLMKAVFGLIEPWQGSIDLDGAELIGCKPYDIVTRGMCYVPQVSNVFTDLSAEENLELGAYVASGSDLDVRKQRVFELFPRLAERRRQPAGKMSGGERQMVAIGSALMLNPSLLLLDEPSAGLSPKMVETIFERIVRINEDGIAVMMVEQNAKESLRMAHRGYVMAAGENRAEGTGDALLNDTEVARLYLGG